jgi:hypothetical protein
MAYGWQQLQPRIPVFLARSPGSANYNSSELWPFLFTHVNQNLARSCDSKRSRLALLRYFVSRIGECSGDRLLLIIDRAHTLHSEELQQLAAFQDDLADENGYAIIALAGYESLRMTCENLHSQGLEEPIRRYFENEHLFYGIRNSQELAYFLESFDNVCYPAESNWPISRFFYPEAFDRGWRLLHEAPRAWSIIRGFADQEGDFCDVEMQYVTEIICGLLENAYLHRGRSLPPDDDAWRAAIASSGLTASRTMKARLLSRNVSKRT